MSSSEYDKEQNGSSITAVNAQVIPYDVLIQRYKAGFRKLVPLHADSKRANVYEGLITEAEIKQFPLAEGKPMRIIQQNPNFWTEERLQNKAHLFYNVATTFGLTDLKDSKGRPLYLYGVDVDSREAYEALKDLIETLKGITYVVKTHKEYGYHFYILTPECHEAMGRANFKLGAEIEFKTDLSLGTMHLPRSRHRKYPYWKYERVSIAETVYIDEDDKVFQEIVKAMSSFFRKEPTEENILTLDAYPPSASIPSGPAIQQQQQKQPSKSLSAEDIDKTVNIILKNTNSYVEYARNDFVYGLSGHFFHNGISELSASLLVGKLCKQASDEEADSRLEVVTETYKKGKVGKPVRGISQLRHLLAKYNNEDEVCVNEILAELNDALKIVNTVCGGGGTGATTLSLTTGKDAAAEEIIKLVESNGDIFFKDAFGQPHAVANVNGHLETIPMDSKKFEYHLRSLLKHNTNRRIISKDSLEKAIQSLMADAVLDGRTIPLHLRVAWQKKNEVIHYDPTDERWSCFAIERDIGTWRILPGGSLTNYPLSELRNPNSKLAEQPVVFTRYGQVPQVIPDRNYPSNIMQQFIEKCTNIKDPKDQLLFKTYLISLFIPDIAHLILLLRGVKGAAKSLLQTMIKRIIDPAQVELLILNNKREDFIINWAHNFYIPYDNVTKVSKRLSSDICPATTGAAFSTRTYYTTADETYLKFRRCFSLSSIGPSLTEDDALQRSITIKLPKIEKQNRKTEEKILAEFDNMLPQLLGYVFDTVARTMQIKDQLDKTGELDGKLERMADLSVWAEAAARTMDYKPIEFLNAFNENLRNQSKDAVNFNVLADIIRAICDEELEGTRVIEYTFPVLLAKVCQKASEMGIEIDRYTSKFSWAKTPQSLSYELIHIATLIEESYGYKIERYTDKVGRNGRKKNTSVIKITNLNLQSGQEQKENKDGQI